MSVTPAAVDLLEQRVRRHLETLDAHGLRRRLHAPHGIDLCSNDYLGLSRHPLLKQRMAEAVMEHGCGSTGSRLLSGERTCFSSIESRFAAFKETEASLYFSTGYLANIAVLTTFTESTDVVLSDECNHASLIDALRLGRARRVVFPHNDVATLRRRLEEESCPGLRFLVVESLFSMDGDEAPLADYAALCRQMRVVLIVDEAHAVGLYGRRGSGLIEETGIGDDVFLSVNTAGKALGVAGAFAAGPAWAIELLVQRARPFIFSTAPPPALAAALDAALSIVECEPLRRGAVLEKAVRLRRQLTASGVPVAPGRSQILPVILGGNERTLAVASALQREGFDVRAIRPPSVPDGTARLRVTVNANLEEADMQRFVSTLAAVVRQTTTCSVASS